MVVQFEILAESEAGNIGMERAHPTPLSYVVKGRIRPDTAISRRQSGNVAKSVIWAGGRARPDKKPRFQIERPPTMFNPVRNW